MRNIVYILLVAIALPFSGNGQGLDPQLSLYSVQPLNMNPALTGNLDHKWQFQVSSREQAYTISQPYRTAALNLDINLPINAWAGNIWGVGFNVVNDDQGDARLLSRRYNLSFALGQYLDARQQHSVSVGFQGGLGQRGIDYTEGYWNNQWADEGFRLDKDPNEPLIGELKNYGDLSTGIQYSYRSGNLMDITTGVGIYHVNTPDISFYKDTNISELSRRYTVHGMMENRLKKDNLFAMRPSFYFTRQGKVNNLIFGNDFVFYFNEPTRTTGKRKEYSMSLGLYHRWGSDLIGSMIFNLAGISFGASYDVTLNNLNALNGYEGAYEVFLGYRAGYRKGSNNKYQRHKKGKL